MPSYSDSNYEALQRKLSQLEEKLRAKEPDLLREIEFVRDLMEARKSEANKTYSGLTRPIEAIDLCLKLNGDYKLAKKEMLTEILSGGYVGRRPKAARGLLNDSILHHIEIGYLSEKNGLIGRPNPKKELARRR